jgi:tRNA(Ile)-lysidine synthase
MLTGCARPPIRDDELAGLLDGLSCHRALLIAVSGGPDSMALLHLLVRWRTLRQAACLQTPLLTAATVDHDLREGSRTEAIRVGEAAEQLGVGHHILTWTGPKPATAVQANARAARYALLASLATDLSASAVVTAHTRDDQAETFLMRLARGSGVDGLAAMRPVERLPTEGRPAAAGGVATPRGSQVAPLLARPLLGIPKARLVATLSAVRGTWIEDPSNSNPAFERTRLRAAMPMLAAIGLDSGPIALSARRLSRARDALDQVTRGLWRDLVDSHEGAFATLPAARWREQPEELRIRLLCHLLQAFGGNGDPVPLSKAERLADRLADPQAKACTIAGCRVEARAGELRVWREAGRRGIPELQIPPGQSATWDHRFRISVPERAGSAWQVTSLAEARQATGIQPHPDSPARIARRISDTLPVIWLNGIPVLIPHLGWQAEVPATVAEDIARVRLAFLGGL